MVNKLFVKPAWNGVSADIDLLVLTFSSMTSVLFSLLFKTQETMTATPLASSVKKTEKQFREELEALNRQNNALNEQRIRIQTEIERARKEKQDLETALIAEFGTSDVAELAKILEDRERGNEEALLAYRQGIEALRQELESVSQKLAQAK